ncbi:NAD(+) diphosphatase [Longimicrobium sp.]|uniref:NAD(+) diphosphatase n=1 Tax=Longimicrobium sp. TaxID=2029185 RepID=UPI002E339AF8|nr:NAD(+) diphosphatase [Longimicrobium sp.]HEX6042214.1 NAD(+) diphosphatase [Longimicrobium sp.]
MTDNSPPHDAPPPGALCFAFRGGELLVAEDGDGVRVPRVADSGLHAESGVWVDAGEADGLRCFAVSLPDGALEPPGMRFVRLRRLYPLLPAPVYRMAGRASEIVEWEHAHRFCGRCGGRTVASGEALARRCTQCGALHYPRLAPAVLVCVADGDRLLLARSPHFPAGMYSTLAGFVEPGESLEEAAAREVREEVGIEIAGLRYFGSQPWPFPSSLMVAFTAEYAGGDLRPDPAEIEDARWFTVDAMPAVPPVMSLARAMIDDWVRAHGGDPSALETTE